MSGYIVLETGEVYKGRWLGGQPRAGEVVFNTSHSGYEEIATDPSYYNQIMVMTAPMQGNYGVSSQFWESGNFWINGFVALQVQSSNRDRQWHERLMNREIPVIEHLNTRKLVMRLREKGTVWGAAVEAQTQQAAKDLAAPLIENSRKGERDWCYHVSRKETQVIDGTGEGSQHVVVVDFGCKQNILRELSSRFTKVSLVNSRTSAEQILAMKPDGVLLSNGPGDPGDVQVAVETVTQLLGQVPIFGICMGHQILATALGGSTFKLKFGHRGSNHPVKDLILQRIYVTSQNHGYAVDPGSLPSDIEVTHTNLNDGTVSGLRSQQKKCFSVQFHPECHPGPRDALGLFDTFAELIKVSG